MNPELLKKLAKQAGYRWLTEPDNSNAGSFWDEQGNANGIELARFAELIVRECARKVGDLMDYTDYPNDTEKSMIELKTLRDARQVIKEHFGVE